MPLATPNPTTESTNQADAPVGPHPLDRRAAAFRGVEEARHELLNENGYDLGEFVADEPDATAEATPEATVAASSEPSAEETEPEPDASAEPIAEPSAPAVPQKFTVTVDGQQREVTLDELTRSYSLEAAARNRFDAANRMLKSVETIQSRLARGESDEPAELPATATPSAPAEPPALGVTRDELRKTVQVIQTGDADEATVALEDALRRAVPKGAAVDTAATIKEATDRAVWQIRWDDAVKRFADEYKDILADKTLALNAGHYTNHLVKTRYEEALARGEEPPELYSLFQEAGNAARDWVTRQAERFGFKKDSTATPSTEDPEQPGPEIRIDARTRTTRKEASPQLTAPARAPARRLNDTPAVAPEVSIEAQRAQERADLIAQRTRGGRP